MEKEGFKAEWEKLRESFRSGKTKEKAWRKCQLEGLIILLIQEEDDIFMALKQDLGKHQAEAFRDEMDDYRFLTVFHNFAGGNTGNFCKFCNEKLEPMDVEQKRLSMEPLIGAIASGSTVVLKPSESSPASASVLANIIHTYLDNSCVKVIRGGHLCLSTTSAT